MIQEGKKFLMIQSAKYTGMIIYIYILFIICILTVYDKIKFLFHYFLPNSVGALLWEIAELRKPHSDINRSEILVNIRTRVRERYHLPFSDNVPIEWIFIVSRGN